MVGRYGDDNLNRLISLMAVTAIIISMFIGRTVLYPLALLLLVLYIFRIFSKNIARRRQENYTYMRLREKPARWFRGLNKRFRERKTHSFFKCPSCHIWNRVPKGRGQITITCPVCHTSFDRKT